MAGKIAIKRRLTSTPVLALAENTKVIISDSISANGYHQPNQSLS